MAKSVLSNLDMGGVSRILNIPNGVANQEPATVAQLNAAIEGLSTKDNVKAASTANVTLTSPGATIDGITLATGDSILLKDQTNSPDNGIYIWNGATSALTRRFDASANPDLLSATVTVDQGTANGGTSWRQTAVNITLGTTNILWTPFGVVSPPASTTTAGIASIATQTEVNAGTVTNKIVTPQTLAAFTGLLHKMTGNVGDGSSTSFAFNHNLGTQLVQVQVYRNSTPFDTVECDVQRTSTSIVTLLFNSAPAANAYTVVVVG